MFGVILRGIKREKGLKYGFVLELCSKPVDAATPEVMLVHGEFFRSLRCESQTVTVTAP